LLGRLLLLLQRLAWSGRIGGCARRCMLLLRCGLRRGLLRSESRRVRSAVARTVDADEGAGEAPTAGAASLLSGAPLAVALPSCGGAQRSAHMN